VVKSLVVNVAEKAGYNPSGIVERGERKRTTVEVSKSVGLHLIPLRHLMPSTAAVCEEQHSKKPE